MAGRRSKKYHQISFVSIQIQRGKVWSCVIVSGREEVCAYIEEMPTVIVFMWGRRGH